MHFLIILALAALNRARGDDTWLTWLRLPGRALWYVAPVVGLLVWTIHPLPVAAAWALAYLVWAVPAWGRWYDLGRLPPPVDGADPVERVIARLAGSSDHTALFIRHLFIVPGLALVSLASSSWWPIGAAIPAAALIVGTYEAAWRWAPRQPILVAELIVGVIWGALIVGT